MDYKKQLTVQGRSAPSWPPNTALKAIPAASLIESLSQQLDKLAKLYAVPGWDAASAVILAEWIMEEYRHHDWDLVWSALQNPPRLNDQAWRLTPDTVAAWIDLKRKKRAELDERKESFDRQRTPVVVHEPLSQETSQLIEGLVKRLGMEASAESMASINREKRKVRQEDKIRTEGRKASGYVPDPDNAIIHFRKMEAIKSRGLDKVNASTLKSFDVEGKIVTARTAEEAREIYLEVYL